MVFEREIKSRIKIIEEIIGKFLPKEQGPQKKVIEAMNYSILAGGKRLRPMLMQETYELFGGKTEVIEPFMAAMEMIHTYSLVHDDLPAMDNDEYRRGRKTTHIVYGEDFGILAGDGLLNYAFETSLKAFEFGAENPYIPQALQVLAKKAGIYGMIGGQAVDVEYVSKKPDIEIIDFIYKNKTSALLESSMLIGAILAGANQEEQRVIEQTATNLGMAFQIQDDILDIIGTQEVLGKPIGSDERNQKITYVTLRGMDQAKEQVEKLSRDAVDGLKTLGMKNEFLEELILYLIHREK